MDFYDIKSVAKSDQKSKNKKTDENYKKLLATLIAFLDDFYEHPTLYFTHTDLSQQRALDTLQFAFIGYGYTFDEAIDVINEADTSNWSAEQLERKRVLEGLVDNLIYFAVAEEHQVLMEMQKDKSESESYGEFKELAMKTFEKYNKTYARVEDAAILFALGAAKKWNSYKNEDIIQYTTQRDERVRESHAILDGIRYRKSQFPEALVPPIDWGCRCYLINTGSTDGRTLTNKPNMEQIIKDNSNSAFKYNVGVSGQMFSEEHPYFNVKTEFLDTLRLTATKIKRRILG